MNEKRQEWITPELVEYGDVARLTEEGKGWTTGDGQGQGQDTGWISGKKHK